MPVELTLPEEELQEQIIERAVAQIIEPWYREDPEEGGYPPRLQRYVDKRVREMIDTHLEPQVLAIIDAGLNEQVPDTDAYGTPKGPPKTVRERIIELARAQLKLSDNRPGYGGGRNKTALDEYLGREVDKAIKNDLGEEFAQARKEIAAAFSRSVSKILTDALDMKKLGL